MKIGKCGHRKLFMLRLCINSTRAWSTDVFLSYLYIFQKSTSYLSKYPPLDYFFTGNVGIFAARLVKNISKLVYTEQIKENLLFHWYSAVTFIDFGSSLAQWVGVLLSFDSSSFSSSSLTENHLNRDRQREKERWDSRQSELSSWSFGRLVVAPCKKQGLVCLSLFCFSNLDWV